MLLYKQATPYPQDSNSIHDSRWKYKVHHPQHNSMSQFYRNLSPSNALNGAPDGC